MKKKEIFKKGLGTRGIGLVLLRLLSKKKKSKFSIPRKNSRFPNFFKKTKKIINQIFNSFKKFKKKKIQDFQIFQKKEKKNNKRSKFSKKKEKRRRKFSKKALGLGALGLYFLGCSKKKNHQSKFSIPSKKFRISKFFFSKNKNKIK